MFQLAPVFSSREIFGLGKMTLAVWIAAIFMMTAPIPKIWPENPIAFSLAIVCEFGIGILIGFVAQIMTIGLESAGALMDTQAGLSAASMLDPASGRSVTIITQLLLKIAILVFMMMNGHLMLLTAIHHSFLAIPVASPVKFDPGLWYAMQLGVHIFNIAVQFSAPILLIIFLVDFCFGMLSRVAPQVNVFQLGFQVKPIVALFIFVMMAPSIYNGVTELMNTTAHNIAQLLSYLAT